MSPEPREELKGLVDFIESGKIKAAQFTTLSATGKLQISGSWVNYMPTSLYCYTIGSNITKALFDFADD